MRRTQLLVAMATLGLLIGVAAGPAGARPTPDIPVTIIGGLPVAVAVNDHGLVAGAIPGPPMHLGLFVSRQHALVDLGALGGFDQLQVAAIDHRDTIVGTGFASGSLGHAFAYAVRTHTFTDLNTRLGADGSVALGVNHGRVAGASISTTSSGTTDRAVVVDLARGVTTFIPGLPGDRNAVAVGVSDAGLVAGASWTGGSVLTAHGFVYDLKTGITIPIPTTGGVTVTAPRAMSATGEVVGGWGGGDAFSFEPSTGITTALATVAGDTSSQAWGVNALGQIVGESTGSICHAVLWGPGGTTVTPIGPVHGPLNWFATGINDYGKIVGLADSATTSEGFAANVPPRLRVKA